MSDTSTDILASLPPDLRAKLPSDALCTTALSLATSALPQAIFNHSLRVFLFARWLAEKEGADLAQQIDTSLLFVACICHDLGTSNLYNGEQRFEVEGADVASHHCASHGIPTRGCHQVWTAIALHTSPGIAERIDLFTRLVRLGVKLDFSSTVREAHGALDFASDINRVLPRLGIEKVLADAVVSQARKIPEHVDAITWPDSEKHPKASWPGILLRAHVENPDYKGVNPAF